MTKVVSDPDNPIVRMMEGNWQTILAILMKELNISEFQLTRENILSLNGEDKAIVADMRNGEFWIRLMNARDAYHVAANANKVSI